MLRIPMSSHNKERNYRRNTGMYGFICELDKNVQEVLCRYNIDKLFGFHIIGYRIECDDNFCTYNPPNKIFISRNIINSYPQEEFDWLVLHECGHLYKKHPWHPRGLTEKKYELCADYWACKQQDRTKYGINALLLLCNGDTSKISHTIKDHNLSRWHTKDIYREWKEVPKFTFGVRITALKNCDLPYDC